MRPILTYLFLLLAATSLLAQTIQKEFQNPGLEPLIFEENKGQIKDQNDQARKDILFAGKAGELVYHLKADGMHYSLNRTIKEENPSEKEGDKFPKLDSIPPKIENYRVDMNWLGCNNSSEIQRIAEMPGYNNYYNVPKSTTPALFVRSYGEILYKDLYENIDLHFYRGSHGGLEYDFIVSAGGDYKQIRIEIRGAQLSVTDQRELVISTPFGDIIEGPLRVFQGEKELKSEWVINENIVSFEIEDIDPAKSLRIDPQVRVWGTYYGSDTYLELGGVDPFGNIILAGTISISSTFQIATSGAHQSTVAGSSDAYLVKFSSEGFPIWTTYYGGTQWELVGGVGTSDINGNIYLAGETTSLNNIATPGSHSPTFMSMYPFYGDGFLVKFDSSGVRQWGTYFGGSGGEYNIRCSMNIQGDVYFTGATSSSNAIATPGTYKPTFTNGEGFLAKFNSAGTQVWGTYLGGDLSSTPNGCAVDNSGNIYLAGHTPSISGITTPGTHQSSSAGGWDAFILKFDSLGNRLWGTYYGGPLEEKVRTCFLDQTGNVFLTGVTQSLTGIASSNAYQNSRNVIPDAFIAKFDPNGLRLWGTYLGGTSDEEALYGTIDKKGNVFIVGQTSSPNIATPGAYKDSLNGNYDGFIAHFHTSGLMLTVSYIGGSDSEILNICAVNDSNHVYIGGSTYSNNNIASALAYEDSLFGLHAGYLMKFAYCNSVSQVSVSTCDSSYISPSGGYTWSLSGTYLDTLTNINGCDSILIIDLSFEPSSSLNIKSCGRYTSPSGNYTWNSTGLYSDTLISSGGCDSVVYINLTVNQSSTDTIFFTSCDKFTSPVDSNIYSNSGIYVDTLINITGCDSIVTLYLTINHSTNGTDIISSCDVYTWIDGQTYTSSSNSATHILTNSLGCDSIVTLDLTIHNSIFGTDVITTCNAYTWIDGNTYSSSNNTATDTLTGATGCDSIVTLDLTIYNIDTSVISNATTLTTNTSSAAYQWIDCSNNFVPLPGETGKSFTAMANGSYAVIITDGPCADTSGCHSISGISLSEYELGEIEIYPNPTSGDVYINFAGHSQMGNVSLLNAAGQKLWQRELNGQQLMLPGSLAAGIYYLEINLSDDYRKSFKLVVQ